ncbi:MAG TPA: hypothetical protein VGJ51_06115 [Candidatus Angelobacter sp.]
MGWFPPAAIMFCLRKGGNAPQVKSRSTVDQQKIKYFVLNSFGSEATSAAAKYQPADG